MTKPTPSHCYTVLDLAARWQISRNTVSRMILDGQLKAFRVGDQQSSKPRYRISADEVARFEASSIDSEGKLISGPRQSMYTNKRKSLPPVGNWGL